MVCKLAGKAIFEDGLGLLSDHGRTELADHCKQCEPCRRSWRSSSALNAGFLALRSLPAPAIDIHQDVLRQIRTIPPAPARGFAWALTASIPVTAGFIVLTLALLPRAVPLLQAMVGGGATLIRSITPLMNLGSALVQLGGLVTRPILAAGSAFGAVEPLGWNILIAGACTAIALSFAVVSRAFLTQEPAVSPKES